MGVFPFGGPAAPDSLSQSAPREAEDAGKLGYIENDVQWLNGQIAVL